MYFMMLADGSQWNEKQHTGGPPYPLVIRSKTYSAHVKPQCECEALASLRHMYLGSFFLDPEDIRSLGLGATWNFSKATGLP